MQCCAVRWIRFSAAGLAFLAAVLLAGCGGGTHSEALPKAGPPELPTIATSVVAVQPSTWPTIVRTQGSLIADEVTIVGTKVAGRVNDVTFDLGDQVKSGVVLAALENEDFKLQVVLAEAQLLQSRAALGLDPKEPVSSLEPQNAPPVREAKAVWDETRARVARMRQLQLNARNTVTQEEYDQAHAAEGAAEARHAAAINAVREKIAQISVRESELNLAKQRLTDTVVRAPFDGWVRERHIGHGSYVQLGDPVATLVRTSVVRFRGTMPERYAHQLAMGQQVRLSIVGVEQLRIAKVTRISPTVEELSRSLVFEAILPNVDGARVRQLLGPLDEAYVKMDSNGDGELEVNEVSRHLGRISSGLIDAELGKSIFRTADEDTDGWLTLEELQDLEFGALRTGLFAEAEVIVEPEAKALVIPRSALMEFAGSQKVWKIVDGIAREQIVQTARQGATGIEVTKGLAAGDLVLVDALKGRVARIDPIFDSGPASRDANGVELVETVVGEELDSAAGNGGSADR
jgi:multidrug efflux pump subunit AcrA (membrane-fusion protein)